MSYHFTPTGALTDASQTASIAEIKTKTDRITITSNLNLNTMETDIFLMGFMRHSIAILYLYIIYRYQNAKWSHDYNFK